jgi:large subunit ribosomal protein L15
MDFQLKPNKGASKKRKRVGRGPGSGHGKTSTRGNKGQKSRSGGGNPYIGFEGGQMPIYRRLPKRGFTNIFKKEINVVNLDQLNIFEENEEVNIESLKSKGLIRKNSKAVKLLGNGEVSKKLTVKLDAISKSAKKKLEEAGGTFN